MGWGFIRDGLFIDFVVLLVIILESFVRGTALDEVNTEQDNGNRHSKSRYCVEERKDIEVE